MQGNSSLLRRLLSWLDWRQLRNTYGFVHYFLNWLQRHALLDVWEGLAMLQTNAVVLMGMMLLPELSYCEQMDWNRLQYTLDISLFLLWLQKQRVRRAAVQRFKAIVPSPIHVLALISSIEIEVPRALVCHLLRFHFYFLRIISCSQSLRKWSSSRLQLQLLQWYVFCHHSLIDFMRLDWWKLQ